MNSRSLAIFVFCLLSAPLIAEKTTPLHDDWQLQSACKATETGDAISAAQYSTSGWLKTSVPSTVLAAQVKAGVFPDPYFGDNLRKIPGTTYPIGHNFANLPMEANSPYACAWWYRKQFTSPAMSANGNRLWLHFGGINYRGEVWINGHKIADSTSVAGAYRTYDFDITDVVTAGRPNVIAVKTSAPTEKDLGIN